MPVRDGLASGQFQVLSLDVFDTLLWRRVPEPLDMFLVLGNRLAAEGKLASHMSALGFGHLVDKAMGPPLKTILYNHADGRYFTHEQN